MKIIAQNNTEKYQVGKNCIALTYPLGTKDIDAAEGIITGRYPEMGNAVNEVCKEINYVVRGQGSITIENQVFNVGPGDVVCIFPGEKYFWDGNLTLYISCTPAWYPDQHKVVD
jgi:mannose-6-phosphate isomerase-like protein (cupin superfamily)